MYDLMVDIFPKREQKLARSTMSHTERVLFPVFLVSNQNRLYQLCTCAHTRNLTPLLHSSRKIHRFERGQYNIGTV